MLKKKTSILDTVKHFYVYFFAAVGTIMIIVGVYQFSKYIFNSYVVGEYRLETWREERCDYFDGGFPGPIPVDPVLRDTEPSDEAKLQQQQKCLQSLAKERSYQQKKDLFDSVMITGLGIIVFAIHFGWMRKKFL